MKSPYKAVDYGSHGSDLYDQKYEIEIENDFERKFECTYINTETNGCLNDTNIQTGFDVAIRNKSFNIGSKTIKFKRNYVSYENLRKWNNQRFTGFKITWQCQNCSGTIQGLYGKILSGFIQPV